jgi:hypothetical protein
VSGRKASAESARLGTFGSIPKTRWDGRSRCLAPWRRDRLALTLAAPGTKDALLETV